MGGQGGQSLKVLVRALSDFEAVSYTHLDVYKRQTRYFAEQGILFHGKELIRPTLAQMLRNPVYVQADLDAVSYTHLDVYKRQGTNVHLVTVSIENFRVVFCHTNNTVQKLYLELLRI